MSWIKKIAAPIIGATVGVVTMNPQAGMTAYKATAKADDIGGKSGKIKYDKEDVADGVVERLKAAPETTAVNPSGQMILLGLAGFGLLMAFRKSSSVKV